MGYDNTGWVPERWLCLLGKLSGEDIDQIESLDAPHFVARYLSGHESVLDVRRKSEYDTEHVLDAENFPLDFINQNMSALSKHKKYLVHCAGGYRSVIAISILRARGYNNLRERIRRF